MSKGRPRTRPIDGQSFGLSVPKETWESFKTLAKTNKITMNELINNLILGYIEEQRITHPIQQDE